MLNLIIKQKTILLILFFGILVSSCKKEIINNNEKRFPVKYLLTKNFQNWFKRLVSEDSLYFINANSEILLFKSDGMNIDLKYGENEARHGQQFSNYFTCQSDYLKTFKIGYQLYAESDTSAILLLGTISGNLANTGKSRNYYMSLAELLINPLNDTFIVEKFNSRIKFMDSVTLFDKTFPKCYLIDSAQYLINNFSTYYYFNTNKGFIGFNTVDMKDWVRIIK